VTWSEYVGRTVGDDQGRDFESKTGLDGSTLSRWKRGEVSGLRADKVSDFARGYNVSVLEAYIEAGFLSPEEAAARPARRPDLTTITNDELVELVRQRLARAGGGDDRDAPSTNTVSELSEHRPKVREKRVARRPEQ
jgi:transcriptional regulator with XRE-family HTH domain